MTVFILFQTDIHRTRASRVFFGVFTSETLAIDHAKERFPVAKARIGKRKIRSIAAKMAFDLKWLLQEKTLLLIAC